MTEIEGNCDSRSRSRRASAMPRDCVRWFSAISRTTTVLIAKTSKVKVMTVDTVHPLGRFNRGVACCSGGCIIRSMAPSRITLVAHTHWDREWYEPFEVFRAHLVEMLDEALD